MKVIHVVMHMVDVSKTQVKSISNLLMHDIHYEYYVCELDVDKI
jgi:hypothetical protein